MRMTSYSRAAALFVCLLWTVHPAPAADNKTGNQANPLGAIKSWSAQVENQQTAAVPSSLSPETLGFVQRINGFFNELIHLQGRFVQTDPNNDRTKGRFYVQRPGRLRFDYAPPSKLRIVADGQYLSIEDHDLNTVDKYPLDSTPFRMLLAADVNLFRDANIVNFARNKDLVALTLEDKTGESPGLIKLFFTLKDNGKTMEIKEWVITDPQGLDTRIELGNLVWGKEKTTEFFSTTSVAFPKFGD